MRVSVTIDVPTATSAEPLGALRSALSQLFSNAGRDVPTPPVHSGDRLERGCIGYASFALEGLALRRPAEYVHHGALRVPITAERSFEAAVRYLRHDSAMDSIIARVEHSRTEYTLRLVHNGDDRYDPNAHTIAWDPTSALRTTAGGRQSPALGLGHEMAHAAAPPWRMERGCHVRLARYDNAEERRVIRGAEAHAARTLGEGQRHDHRGRLYRVDSPVRC